MQVQSVTIINMVFIFRRFLQKKQKEKQQKIYCSSGTNDDLAAYFRLLKFQISKIKANFVDGLFPTCYVLLQDCQSF